MTALQRRFKITIDLLGDTLIIGGNAKKAVMTILTRGYAYSLLSSAEVDVALRPMRLAYVAHDDTTSVGSTVTWEGIIYTVKKVLSARFQDATIVKMLVLG